MKPTMLHVATLSEILFTSPWNISFSEDFQQIPVSLAKFKHIDNCFLLFVRFYPNLSFAFVESAHRFCIASLMLFRGQLLVIASSGFKLSALAREKCPLFANLSLIHTCQYFRQLNIHCNCNKYSIIGPWDTSIHLLLWRSWCQLLGNVVIDRGDPAKMPSPFL